MRCDTPVLLIAWRRPSTTQRVLRAIREVKPKSLYVFCDGPNPSSTGEADKVKETRRAIENGIDWDCNVFKNYSSSNLGCKKGVSSAISWFFKHNESGIILEDDCVPDQSFFEFCGELLETYKTDKKVFCISGVKLHQVASVCGSSYYFSRYPHCWGWATWRDRWSLYNPDIPEWAKVREMNLSSSLFINNQEREFWCRAWDAILEGKQDTWDYQWNFYCMLHRALSITPHTNLVENIGFGEGATHTTDRNQTHFSAGQLEGLVHPPYILPDMDADAITFRRVYARTFSRRMRGFLKRCLNQLETNQRLTSEASNK